MKRTLICTLLATLALGRAAAESDSLRVWTLNDCLNYALEHNIQLQQSRNDYLSGVEDTKEARAALFPSLTASTSQSVTNYPSSNAVDRTSYTGTYGLEASMTLYNGGARPSSGSSCRTASTNSRSTRRPTTSASPSCRPTCSASTPPRR